MSEENWKKMKELLDSNQKETLEQVKVLIGSGKKEEPEPKHEHWTAESILNTDCPECKKEIEKIEAQAFKKQKAKSLDEYPIKCKECGSFLKEEDTERCSTCGSNETEWR